MTEKETKRLEELREKDPESLTPEELEELQKLEALELKEERGES